MKYTITINQKAVVDLGLDLDLIDLVIFDFIKDFSQSSKIIKKEIEGEEYFWIKYEHIMENLPLLQITNKRIIGRRLDKLVDAKLLEKKIVNGNSTYFKFGSNYDLYLFSDSDVLKSTPPCTQKYKGDVLKSTSINYNINNNNINKYKENNNILSNDNILLQKKQKSFLEIFENEINNEDFISLLKAKYNLEDAYLKKVAGDFCLYRTEKNPNGRKEKWQMQKTFDIKRRFYTRLSNDQKYSKKTNFTPKNSIGVIE